MTLAPRNVFIVRCASGVVSTTTQKAKGKHDFRIIPNGVNGLEERMVVVYDTMVSKGLIDLPRYVEVTSTAAAKVFNAYPQKGCVCVGSDADLVVFDPSQKTTVSAATHHSAAARPLLLQRLMPLLRLLLGQLLLRL